MPPQKAVETDLSIFLHFTKAPIIAVTGSKGKSSTVSAIDYGLRGAGFKAYLGGNITVSPLSFLEKTDGTTEDHSFFFSRRIKRIGVPVKSKVFRNQFSRYRS